MVSQLSKPDATDVFYPDSDGQPIANNTEHFQWIVTIRENLNWLLEDAFVAGDLFWYPVEGRADVVVAPDVMVALGRPKGKRPSYNQWEENNQAPQVIFEIVSPSNTRTEMDKKLLFLERYGVEEYYLYDLELRSPSGFLRQAELGLELIPDMTNWVSPLLNIRFDTSGSELILLRPDGSPFLSDEEVLEKADAAEQKASRLAAKLKELGIDPEQV